MDTWILKMVRTRCVRRVVAWSLATGFLIWLMFTQQRYIGNFIMGPSDLSREELNSIEDVGQFPKYFVRVTGSKVINTGIQQVTTHKRGGVETSRSISANYYALVVGNKLLLTKSASEPSTTIVGELTAVPSDIDRKLFDTPDMQSIRSLFYPFYLDNNSFRFPGYCALIGVLIFGVLFYRQAIPAWKQLQDPRVHPLIKRVASWGDPIGISMDVERESNSPIYKGDTCWIVSRH